MLLGGSSPLPSFCFTGNSLNIIREQCSTHKSTTAAISFFFLVCLCHVVMSVQNSVGKIQANAAMSFVLFPIYWPLYLVGDKTC